jgi:GrpB-like predicted nucleotidyltransferase (UPF0157 family)
LFVRRQAGFVAVINDKLPVELVPHRAEWTAMAQAEAERLKSALGTLLIAVHHIGSTAIPGIKAKPIVDLIPLVSDIAALDTAAGKLEAQSSALPAGAIAA